MKKIILSIVFLCFFQGVNVCAKVKLQPLLPYTPYNPYNSGSTVVMKDVNESAYPKINQAEQRIFGRTYANEDITGRLSRLESKIFGKAFPYMSLSERTENITQRVGLDSSAVISNNELAQMEQRIFMKTYPYDDPQMRVTRLEKEIFGAMQGGDLAQRVETLRSATKYYNAFPPKLSNQSTYYSNPYYESFQTPKVTLPSIIRKLGEFFAAPIVTGYSPNIVYPNNVPYSNYNGFDSLSPYSSPFGIQRSYSGPGFKYDTFRHYGQGSTVNILQD